MNEMDLSADVLTRGFGMVKQTLAEFTDAEMLVRPCPGANHAAWQIGHLVTADTSMLKLMKPDIAHELPAGFAEKFNKSTASNDDPAFFPKKADLMNQFEKTRQSLIATVKTLTPADLAKPTPERMTNFAPTIGHLVQMAGGHLMMHLGQFQVIRRKLGKPILF
jgi:DinB superfamily